MKSNRKLCGVALAGLLAGCAHTPDVSVNYFLSQTTVKMKATRTVACDASKHPIIATTITPTATHSADRSARRSIPLNKLEGDLSNNDVKVELREDGRLKGINATGTGQGEAILKSALTLAGAIFGLDGGSRSFDAECKIIAGIDGGKPVTVTYLLDVDLGKSGLAQKFTPDLASEYYEELLRGVLGGVCATVAPRVEPAVPVVGSLKASGVMLAARQPAELGVKVTAGTTDCGSKVVWDGVVPAAQFGKEYAIPIPASPAFGKRVFVVAFEESGAVTTIQYASDTGANQVLGVANAALTAIEGQTAAQQAAELKAEGDLIVQQQRLVACRADRANCK